MCNMAYHKGYFIRLIEILGDNHSKNESNTTIYTQVSFYRICKCRRGPAG